MTEGYVVMIKRDDAVWRCTMFGVPARERGQVDEDGINVPVRLATRSEAEAGLIEARAAFPSCVYALARVKVLA